MSTCWSQEHCDGSTRVERKAERNRRIHPEPLVPEEEPLFSTSYTRWRAWLIGWDVLGAAMVGMVIFLFLDFASLGVLGTAVTVVAIMAAVGLGHYLLWGRVFARGLVRERQRVQDQARRTGTAETKPPDEFLLGLNNLERMELLLLLEHSLEAATDGGEGSKDGAAIRRELQDKIRMFGA